MPSPRSLKNTQIFSRTGNQPSTRTPPSNGHRIKSLKAPITLLAASVLAASAEAVITPGSLTSDSSAIAVLKGTTGAYVYDLGFSAGDLAAGASGYIDFSSALADIGTLESYAVFGTLACDDPACVGGFGYADAGLGWVAAGVNTSQNAVPGNLIRNMLGGFISSAAPNGGLLPPVVGGGGPFGIDPFGDPTLASEGFMRLATEVTNLFSVTETTSVHYSVSGPLGDGGGGAAIVSVTGNSLLINCPAGTASCPQLNPVPLPAAAWLFATGLLGLGVARRR